MIRRTFSPVTHNRVGNIPGVLKTITLHLKENDCVDFAECANRPDRYIMLTDFGGAAALFEQITPAVFEGHSLFDPALSGAEKLARGREIIAWMWEHTGAKIIYGITPAELRHAAVFNRRLGFKSDGKGVLVGEHWTHEMEYFSMLRPTK